MENKLQQLKKVIWKANPSILELKFGCYFSGEGVSNGLIVRMIDSFPFFFTADYHHKGSGIVYKEFDRKKIEILGRPIRLADVLLAIRKKRGILIDVNGIFYDIETIKSLNLGCAWDMEKDLDNQSDECKEFLIKLLIK